MTDRRPPLSDDRLDELVRAATLAGPTEPDRDRNELPPLTLALLASGLLGVAAVALAAAVWIGPAAGPTAPVAERDPAEGAPAESATAEIASVEARNERPVETGSGGRSLVVARFSPEESARLAWLFDGQPTAEAPAAEDSAAAARVVSTVAAASPPPPAVDADRIMALGRALRSADAARDALALMPAAEQLAACRLWAAEPSLRPIAFERLSVLSMHPTVADDVRRAARSMASDPSLTPWLRSYGLAMGPVSPSATP